MHENNPIVSLVRRFLATTLMIATACGGVVDEIDAPQSIQDLAEEASLQSSLSGSALRTVNVSASGSTEGSSPRHAVDGDRDTRWSCGGMGCWIRLDLGSTQSLNGLAVSWQPHSRIHWNNFVISVSDDDKNYRQVYSGRSWNRTSRFEGYDVGGAAARYVRLTVSGRTPTSETGVHEMRVFGRPESSPSAAPQAPAEPSNDAPPPVACTSFGYSAWSTCSAGATQSRTVTSSQPAGCTGGAPELSRACTPPPAAPPSCTSFSYSAWGSCSAGGTQTRTVTGATPSGCTGGTPVLSRVCTPPAPTCTSFTYSTWGTCSAGGTQTRTVASSSPSGCTGGSPVLSQSCTPPAQTPPAPSTPTAGDYDSLVLSDAPVAFWGMGSGGSGESDLTGKGHAGTYKGGTPAVTTMPNGEGATVFNGSSHYLTIPSSSAFSIPTTGNLTFEAWIRPDSLQFPVDSSDGYVDWMGKCQQYSPSCEWEARMYSSSTAEGRPNRMSAYAFNSSAGLGSAADWQPNNGLIQAGRWYHVVGEYSTRSFYSDCSSGSSPGSITIYVNGVEWNHSAHGDTGCMSQYSVRPTAGNSPVNIGTMALDTFFKGAIGKVAIYNRLLSADEVASHYKAMTGKSPSGTCGSSCSLTSP